ncbi:MAG: CPBP family intramembrane metalloprotease [Deltaproteobacteria bacterium]|nr:CPBP family intramembrane metalloprotease [Deltaproteobacteria bacterium]
MEGAHDSEAMEQDLKRRLLIELLVLGVLTLIFLFAFPQRAIYIDGLLAVLALALIGLNARFTKNSVWAQFPPMSDLRTRARRSYALAGAFTIPAILVFAVTGFALGYRQFGWEGAWARVSNWHILVAFLLYLPWALLQQFLFQFYLLGRLLTLLPASMAVIATGLAYSFVHLPEVGVVLATAPAGIFWTFLYYRDRLLLPLGLSHALLASTFYYWVYGQDLLMVWQEVIK